MKQEIRQWIATLTSLDNEIGTNRASSCLPTLLIPYKYDGTSLAALMRNLGIPMDDVPTRVPLSICLVHLYPQSSHDARLVAQDLLTCAREFVVRQKHFSKSDLPKYVHLRLAMLLYSSNQVRLVPRHLSVPLRSFIVDDHEAWVWLFDGEVETVAAVSFQDVLGAGAPTVVFPKLFDEDPYGASTATLPKLIPSYRW